MTTATIALDTIIDADTELTIGEMIHLEVEHTLSKLGLLPTYSEAEAREMLLAD